MDDPLFEEEVWGSLEDGLEISKVKGQAIRHDDYAVDENLR